MLLVQNHSGAEIFLVGETADYGVGV